MKKKAIRTGLFLALALGASSAAAEPFGTKGEFAFAGERLMGFFYTHASESNGASNSSTQIGLLGQAPASVGPGFVNPLGMPRVGFDYFIIDGLTIGGALVYTHLSNTAKVTQAGTTVSQDTSGNAFIFAPRVGYAYMFSDIAGIWPRGGFTYHYQSGHANIGGLTDTTETVDGFALSIEAPFVISPVEHFAILVGPSIDIGLSGNQKIEGTGPFGVRTSNNFDDTLMNFGIYGGLLGWI